MGVKIEGIIDVQNMLLRLDTNGRKRVVKGLYALALETADLARKFAPVDHGNLEEAIKVNPPALGMVRDGAGRFARTEIEVYIDTDMSLAHRPGKTVGDYAYEIHEHQTPYGPIKLGERSRAKQASQPEQVGGGFLERAAEQINEKVEGTLLDILRDL